MSALEIQREAGNTTNECPPNLAPKEGTFRLVPEHFGMDSDFPHERAQVAGQITKAPENARK